MKLYSRNNAAKQFILEDLDKHFGQSAVTVLDLGCGDASNWGEFMVDHATWRYLGIDTDRKAIERGQSKLQALYNVELRVFDAQRSVADGSFDVVVAFSTIEHVVNRSAFLKTVWQALKPGGIAYLNYDDGHFRSHNIKERLMVPISQMLAFVKIEGPYMRHVNDAKFREQAEHQGFKVLATRKNNLHPIKGLLRKAPETSIEAWYAFEEELNKTLLQNVLDRAMWSTTLVLQKS